jgi:xanthine dehydrogenase YagT iron-sulfur-binding subunit
LSSIFFVTEKDQLLSMKKRKDENFFDTEEVLLTTRRKFIAQTSAFTAAITITVSSPAEKILNKINKPQAGMLTVTMNVNGKQKTLDIDTRTTLLDALRENMHLTGTKKGCDRGQCGACTVLVDGRRINSCLHLAAMCDDAQITTIEGLGTEDNLHPMQEAFLKHDAFQCGYCTPGQICSAVGLLKEGHAKTDDDIRELMSGNICRCGAYQNILEAIKEVQQTG